MPEGGLDGLTPTPQASQVGLPSVTQPPFGRLVTKRRVVDCRRIVGAFGRESYRGLIGGRSYSAVRGKRASVDGIELSAPESRRALERGTYYGMRAVLRTADHRNIRP